MVSRLLNFNPLPPPKRGEIWRLPNNARLSFGFNPLPPPKRGEIAERKPFVTSKNRGFQSAPPAEARGDHTRCYITFNMQFSLGFNPLPPPKRGEIVTGTTCISFGTGITVSIRSPRRSEGRFRVFSLDVG